jgi:hypothetical protein
MSTTLPLLGPRDPAAPLAWHRAGPSAPGFVADAQALAAALPAQGPAVNLCQDRYRFALGLAAALLRGHTSLMPPNALPETLRLARDGGRALCCWSTPTTSTPPDLRRVTCREARTAGAGRRARHPGDLDAVCLLTTSAPRVRRSRTPSAGRRWWPTSPPRPSAWPS